MKLRSSLLAVATLTALALVSCGSGGGNVPGTPGVVAATFTPTNAMPGTNTLAMGPGQSTGDSFQVDVRVPDITDFFGAGFRVTFDPAVVQFQSFDSSRSFLQVNSPNILFEVDVDPNTPGAVLVTAALLDMVQGLDTSTLMTDVLVTLNFRALNATGGSAFTFDTAATRNVKTCPAPPTACADIPDAMLTWSGGTLTAN